ncbi:nSTAND1 domain-containing NTPase [Acaryochloris marina NIES-2412]|uniref:nSTAND1 domain-containing NTPase n=1 Tax=Acaryochloris marina TaxID=155978 RepID=UPI0040586BDF
MSPVSVKTSRSTRALESGEAKLWVVLVGVNHYADTQLSNLAYPALDCQGLGDALATATAAFPQKSIVLHHDHPQASGSSPDLGEVRISLQRMVEQAQPQDTLLFYFSGHGVVDPPTQQTFLCLANTRKEQLLQTGLPVQELLTTLAESAARQQLVWLDACHSGGMSMQLGSKDETPEQLPNPTPQLMALLRQRAAQSKGFYALLSCDQNQQSWEFPELEHGVFTYYLIQGLLGEAADDDGVIEADSLYKYVYYQTLHYIDKVNQQLRLINQQKRGRGETQLDAEYPQQTPKRIVEGVGELVLGLQPELPIHAYPRQALMVAGLADNPTALALGKVLRGAGAFELTYFPQADQTWKQVREAIQTCLQVADPAQPTPTTVTTALLYLRGKTELTETGEANLVLPEGVAISRSWLRQMLRRSPLAQQVVVLDCPGATDLLDWVEDLQTHYQGQCLLAAAAPADQPEQFAERLYETLTEANAQEGMPVASWIARLQTQLAGSEMQLHTWLSGVQGVIEVLPGGMGARSTTSDFDLGICPYMGLRAFGTDDAPFFFGREALTQQLIEAVRERSFLAVVGASGSGKSSVVQAGLMAQLLQGQHIPGSDQWWVRSLRPGAQPVHSLVERLIESGTAKEQQYQRLQLEGMLYQGTEGFVYWLRSQPQSTIVLVIDQFEELFTLAAPEDRQQFLDLIFGAIDHAGDRFKLVMTLRSDFIAPCLEYPALAQRLPASNILVPPALTTDSYRQVILNPAEQVGLAVDPELVEVLLEELSNLAGDLPLLEFVLEQLWEQRQPGALTLVSYQQQIGGLKRALERKAQDIYDGFDAEGQACAQWIFLALTQLGDGTEDTRRRIKKSDLVVPKYPAELVEGTLKALTDAKLVIVSLEQDLVPVQTLSSKGDEASDHTEPEDWLEWFKQDVTVEVVHEILIRHWSTLRWWLEENRVRLQTQRQIEQAAEDWQQSQQSPDFLLRGVRLDAAAELYVKYTDELSAEVQAFVQAGLSAQEQEQKQTQQRLRRARIAVGVISLLGAVATGLAGLAFLQRQQTQLSEIRALNALSESQLRSHQQLEALLTSTQAARQFQSLWGWGIDGNTLGAIRTQTALTLGDAIAKTQERNRLEGHTQRVTSVSISASGQWIASGSDDQTVRIWQANGQQLHTLEIGEKVNDVAFSPDDQFIAVITTQGIVQRWSPKTGKQLSSFTASPQGTGLAFHPDGQQLATAGRESEIKIWADSTGKLVKTLSGHQGWVNAVAFNATGTVLVSASEDKTVRIWDVAQGQTLNTLPKQPTAVTDIAISSDGQTIASSTEDGTIQLWTLTGKRLHTFQTENVVVTSVAFSPDGSTLVSTHADHSLRLWQVVTGKPLSTLKGHGAATLDAVFHPNSKTLVSASVDKQVRVWSIPSIFEAASLLLAMAVSPDQQTLATASLDGRIQLWRSDPQVGQLPFKSFNGDLQPVYSLRFSADSQQLVSGHDKAIRVWDIHEGTVQRTLSGHTGKVNSLDFSPNGKTLASGSDDQTIRLWDAATGKRVKTIQAHDGPVTSVDFGPRYLASGSDDETVKLWQLDGTPVKTLTGHGLAIAQVQFNSEGDILASASWDNTIKLWQDGTLVQTLTGHQNGVMSLAFLPDQPILISGSPDQSVKAWQVDQGTLLKTLDGLGPVTRINVKDRQIWVSTGATLQKANIDLDLLLAKGCRHLNSYLATTSKRLPSQQQLCSE